MLLCVLLYRCYTAAVSAATVLLFPAAVRHLVPDGKNMLPVP